MTKPNRETYLYLGIAIIAVSFSAIFIRFCGTPSLVIALYRQVFSALLLLPFVRAADENVLSTRDRILLALSGLFLALHFATWITGLQYTTVARATLFVDLQPVWAAILGAFLLKEKLSGLEITGVVLVTLGGAVTMGHELSGNDSTWKGDGLALLGGITGAGYLLIGRNVRARITWVRYMFFVYLASALWLLLMNILFFQTIPLPDYRDLLWIALMAFVPSLIGHGLFNVAVRRLKAYVVNAAFMGEPVIATILAYFFFAEMPDAYFFAGGSVVFAGILLIFSRQQN